MCDDETFFSCSFIIKTFYILVTCTWDLYDVSSHKCVMMMMTNACSSTSCNSQLCDIAKAFFESLMCT